MTTPAQTKRARRAAMQYYLLIGLNRFALLMLGLIAVCYWVVIISAAMSSGFVSGIEGGDADRALLTEQLATTINRLGTATLYWGVLNFVLWLIMFAVPRIRNHDKKLLVTTFVTIMFAVMSVAFAQLTVRAFLAQL